MSFVKISLIIGLLAMGCGKTLVWAASPVWLIENNQNRLYLSGTIHILRPADYPLPAAFDQAYNDSAVVAFETTLDSHTDPTFAKKMARAMAMPPYQKLEDLISEQTLLALKKYLEQKKLSLKAVSHLKPGMIALTLTLLELRNIGASIKGVDQYFYDRALNDRKTIKALESQDQQLACLTQLGEGQEDLIIRHTLQDLKTLNVQFEDMILSWKTGNLSRLKELFIDPMQKHFYPVYQQLLVQRHEHWMPQLITMLDTPETEMVLVGTAHLLGEDGLIYQLNQSGYTVTPLNE